MVLNVLAIAKSFRTVLPPVPAETGGRSVTSGWRAAVMRAEPVEAGGLRQAQGDHSQPGSPSCCACFLTSSS